MLETFLINKSIKLARDNALSTKALIVYIMNFVARNKTQLTGVSATSFIFHYLRKW